MSVFQSLLIAICLVVFSVFFVGFLLGLATLLERLYIAVGGEPFFAFGLITVLLWFIVYHLFKDDRNG